MPNKEIEFGVAWKTVTSDAATSVFFTTRRARSSYIRNLKNNPLVKQGTIACYTRAGKTGKPVLEK